MSKPTRLPDLRRALSTASIAHALLAAVLTANPSAIGAAGTERTETTPKEATHPTAWEYSPYRITIFVEIDASAEWTPKRRFDLTADVERRAHSFVGGLWRLTAREAPAELHWDSATEISHVSADRLPQTALDADKVMLLGLAAGRDGQQSIHAREFDVRTRIWGAPWTVTTLMVKSRPDSDLADQLVRTLWQSFCPIARIDQISDKGVVVCRIRGGALPPANRSLELMPTGSVLRPLVRHFDAQGRTARDGVFPVNWTWLRVEQSDGATATCRLETGVQDPIELRYDGRTEYLGLAVTTRANNSTELIVRAHGDNRPLEDVEIFARGSGGAPANMVGRTDENGAVTIESPRVDVTMLYLRSGDDLLARFPMVPGVEPKVKVAVEDNGRRARNGGFGVACVRRIDRPRRPASAPEDTASARDGRRTARCGSSNAIHSQDVENVRGLSEIARRSPCRSSQFGWRHRGGCVARQASGGDQAAGGEVAQLSGPGTAR